VFAAYNVKDSPDLVLEKLLGKAKSAEVGLFASGEPLTTRPLANFPECLWSDNLRQMAA
jgi:hypothetical protein